MPASEETLRGDLAVVHQEQGQRLPRALHGGKQLGEIARQLLDLHPISDEPVEACLGPLREEQAFEDVVAGDVERPRCVDLLHRTVELGLDVVPLEIQQAHQEVGLLQNEAARVHAHEDLEDLLDRHRVP